MHRPEGSDGLHDGASDINRERGFLPDEFVAEDPDIVARKDSFPLGRNNVINGPAVMEEVQDPESVGKQSSPPLFISTYFT